jgi:hypothetical protein
MIVTIAYSMNTLQLGEAVAGLMGLVSLIASYFIMKAIDKYLLKDTLIIEDIRKL